MSSEPKSSNTPFINSYQTAELLGISLRSVLRLRSSGVLPHIKLGRRTIFRRESIEAAMSRREEGAVK